MFKALTEYVMRGRLQAITVALVGSWLPFVSQAVLGAVTLRKGWQEGLIVTLWASLPAFVGLWMAKVSAPIAFASIVVFFIGYAGCLVLRSTVSWPLALSVMVAASALASVAIVGSTDSVVSDVKAFFEKAVQDQNSEQAQQVATQLNAWNTVNVGGIIAIWIALTTIVGVFMARWWQALAYNPGGFREEFHALRLNSSIATASALIAVLCFAMGGHYQFWAVAAGLPLFFAGLGLAHWLINRFRLGTAAVVVLYFVIPVLSFSILILMVLALLDALLDIRNRFKTDPPQTD